MKSKVRSDGKKRKERGCEDWGEGRGGSWGEGWGGGQTWVNLASGGHTLPEETGASRLASTLMAFTYTHTQTHTHACTHTARTPIPQGRGTSENTARTLISYLYILSCTLQSYLARPASYTILFMDSPPPPTTHHSGILFVLPLPPVCRCHLSKRLPTGCVCKLWFRWVCLCVCVFTCDLCVNVPLKLECSTQE